MDAVTSFELEAQRRRETVASDRWDAAWVHAKATSEPIETAATEQVTRVALPGRRTERTAASADCQPVPAAR